MWKQGRVLEKGSKGCMGSLWSDAETSKTSPRRARNLISPVDRMKDAESFAYALKRFYQLSFSPITKGICLEWFGIHSKSFPSNMLVHLISLMCFWRKTPHFVPFADLVKGTHSQKLQALLDGRKASHFSIVSAFNHLIFLHSISFSLAFLTRTCFGRRYLLSLARARALQES